MALTIWIPFGVETRDLNVYLRGGAIELPPPDVRLPHEGGESVPVGTDDEVGRREKQLFETH